jgi:hypothetical protein
LATFLGQGFPAQACGLYQGLARLSQGIGSGARIGIDVTLDVDGKDGRPQALDLHDFWALVRRFAERPGISLNELIDIETATERSFQYWRRRAFLERAATAVLNKSQRLVTFRKLLTGFCAGEIPEQSASFRISGRMSDRDPEKTHDPVADWMMIEARASLPELRCEAAERWVPVLAWNGVHGMAAMIPERCPEAISATRLWRRMENELLGGGMGTERLSGAAA